MRRFLRGGGKANTVFCILSFFFDIGYLFCLFAPLSMIGLSKLLSFAIVGVLFLLDHLKEPLPTFAYFAHLIFLILSIRHAIHCQNPQFLTFYIICEVVYIVMEIIVPVILVLVLKKIQPRK